MIALEGSVWLDNRQTTTSHMDMRSEKRNTPLHRRRRSCRSRMLEILIPREFVMRRWVVVAKKVRAAVPARSPVEMKLLLGNAIFEPVVVHVEDFGVFHANLGMENVVGSGIVSF